MANKKLSYDSVRTFYPKAWLALPESYKNDLCLAFYLDANQGLCATHDLGEDFVWDPTTGKWCQGE
jgi:hypothetical protein